MVPTTSGLLGGLEAKRERVRLIDELYGRLGKPHAAEAERRLRRASRRDERRTRTPEDRNSRRKF